MKLTTLKIQNFKGIRDKQIEAPDGCSIDILGRNGSGKTTLGDAITYVLFNKDMQGRSPQSFEIKTRDENGDVIHNLEHEVEATFTEPSLTLRKVYSENWSNVRGTEQKLTGHSTEYFIDGESVKKKEYEEQVFEIMDEELFKMLTVPNYFAEQLHWSKRRKMLMEMAGEINDDEIIASDTQLEGYHELLGDKSAESRKKMLERQKKDSLERVDEIPGLIRENQEKIVKVETTAEKANENIDAYKEQRGELEEELAKARSGGGVSHLQVKVDEMENEKRELVNKGAEKHDDKLSDARAVVRRKAEAEDEAKSAMREQTDVVDEADTNLGSAKHKVEVLKDNIAQKEAEKPKPKESGSDLDECPMCGQDMPEDEDADENYQEYLKEFNEKKSEELKALSEDLESAQEELEKRRSEFDKAEKELAELESKHQTAKEQAKEAEADLDRLKSSIPDPKDSEEYKTLTKKQQALEKKINDIRLNNSERINEIQEGIDEIDSKINTENEKLFQIKSNKKVKERIEELKAEQKQMSKLAGEADDGLFMIQRFEVARAEVVTSRVNEMFDTVTWKMHEPLISGGVNDQMCEAIVDGVPYTGGLNNARRVQAGIDIINTIGEHFGKTAPVVIDNAESVSEIETYGLQVIALYVSKEHQELTVMEGE